MSRKRLKRFIQTHWQMDARPKKEIKTTFGKWHGNIFFLDCLLELSFLWCLLWWFYICNDEWRRNVVDKEELSIYLSSGGYSKYSIYWRSFYFGYPSRACCLDYSSLYSSGSLSFAWMNYDKWCFTPAAVRGWWRFISPPPNFITSGWEATYQTSPT